MLRNSLNPGGAIASLILVLADCGLKSNAIIMPWFLLLASVVNISTLAWRISLQGRRSCCKNLGQFQVAIYFVMTLSLPRCSFYCPLTAKPSLSASFRGPTSNPNLCTASIACNTSCLDLQNEIGAIMPRSFQEYTP